MAGIDLVNEALYSQILFSMQLSTHMAIKKKARILVPDSTVLIGVIDDRGILEEDEVFIQIRKDNYSEKINNS